MQSEKGKAGLGIIARVIGRAARGFSVGVKAHNVYRVECRDRFGNLKWVEEIINTTVTTGLNDILDKYWKGSAYTAAHYVGLTSATPSVAAGDTMASHAGWTENQNYTEANRPTLANLGTPASGSVDNSGTPTVFSINTNAQSIGGIFITTDNTKGGATGTLIAAGAFTGGNKAADSGDTLSVTITLTQASA